MPSCLPKAGFVEIHLINRRSRAGIPGMEVSVIAMEKPDSLLFSIGCYSNRAVCFGAAGPEASAACDVGWISRVERERWKREADLCAVGESAETGRNA